MFIAPAEIILTKNDIGKYDTCEQPDYIDEENDLLIEEDCVTELQLESPEVLKYSVTVE